MTTILPVLEALSYLVTIIGLPLAIAVFMLDRRRDRQIGEEEIYLRLSDEYADFMRLVIDNADLRLRSPHPPADLSEEQQERKLALFAILVSLFERAYVLVYEEHEPPATAPVAIVGRLYARVVSARRFSGCAGTAIDRRGPGLYRHH